MLLVSGNYPVGDSIFPKLQITKLTSPPPTTGGVGEACNLHFILNERVRQQWSERMCLTRSYIPSKPTTQTCYYWSLFW